MDQPATATVPSDAASAALSAKKRVEKDVLGAIMDGLSGGEIDSQKAQEIAKETLVTLKMLDEHEETLEKFYKNLSDKYDIFKILYTNVRADIAKAKELSAHRKALAAINAGDLEGARQIATTAILGTANENADLS